MGTMETRHTEKNMLFSLLCAEDMEDIRMVTNQLIAIMEPEDVALVRKQVVEQKQGK